MVNDFDYLRPDPQEPPDDEDEDDAKVDETAEETFPASDPPAW